MKIGQLATTSTGEQARKLEVNTANFRQCSNASNKDCRYKTKKHPANNYKLNQDWLNAEKLHTCWRDQLAIL